MFNVQNSKLKQAPIPKLQPGFASGSGPSPPFVQSSRFKVQGSRFKVQGSGFEVGRSLISVPGRGGRTGDSRSPTANRPSPITHHPRSQTPDPRLQTPAARRQTQIPHPDLVSLLRIVAGLAAALGALEALAQEIE